ncbi:MAG: hypothetical protein E6G52_06325, partial [Actinobacteria bacterium]
MAERFSCPTCGHENDAGQRFCGSCGSRLVLTCEVCGGANPLDSRFCGNCGADLLASTASEPSGEERRVVTILFADLVGFTSRAERLDPEDVRAILTPYYTRLRQEIEAFGGTVEKFIGDAVMAVFGAPVAYGDDPERAVRAALRIRDTVGEMNAADPGLDLQLRIAVNTGEAIVALGARPRDGEAMVAGDVVNTAARLQTAAPVDTILVGEETFRSTRSTVEYEQVEPIAAKGKQAPVQAWRALAAARAPGERRALGVPMIGREDELSALREIWDHVVVHRYPHIVTVFGPPGVGKSRLSAEFAGAVAAGGGQTIRGRSLPYGESGAYGAFAQQVKQVAGIFDNDRRGARRAGGGRPGCLAHRDVARPRYERRACRRSPHALPLRETARGSHREPATNLAPLRGPALGQSQPPRSLGVACLPHPRDALAHPGTGPTRPRYRPAGLGCRAPRV